MTAQPLTNKPKRKRRGVFLRVERNALVPADELARQAMRRKKLKVGDVVAAEIAQVRNIKFHRKAHALGKLCVAQLEAFAHTDAHGAIKKIQADAGICCDVLMVNADQLWVRITEWISEVMGDAARPALLLIGGYIAGRMIPVLTPRSLAFDDMKEDEFDELYRGMCQHLSNVYWPSMTHEQIAAMAEFMPENEP